MGAPAAKNGPLQGGVVDNLKKFAKQNKLKQAALHVIAGYLSDTQVKSLRDLFHSLDKNGDGLLSEEEIRGGIEKSNIAMGTDLQALMKDMDADESGVIDYTEFIAAAIDMKEATREEACWAAFCVFDKDGNGKISMSELKELLQTEGVAKSLGDKAAG